MPRFFKHLRTYIFRGLLALLPLALCYFVLQFLYLAVDQKAAPYLERWMGIKIPGLGFLLVLIILDLHGIVAGNWAGRRLFALIEKVSAHIPLVKTIYHLGQQLGRAFNRPESQGLKRVVLVEQFRPGVWSIGFVTGTMNDLKNGETLLKVFIPTAPNPTAGFMVVVREGQVRDVSWSVSEAMNIVLSGGIVGPDDLT
jgi:uncharacterized membrane protein